jgi:hypothetical protein
VLQRTHIEDWRIILLLRRQLSESEFVREMLQGGVVEFACAVHGAMPQEVEMKRRGL